MKFFSKEENDTENDILDNFGISTSEKTVADISYTEEEEHKRHIHHDELKKILGIKEEKTLDNFKNVREISQGGVGSILSAKDPVLDREVAIKVLRPKFKKERRIVDRFIKEAKAIANVEHPNVIPVHDLGLLKDIGPYFTMKKVVGKNLQIILNGLKKNDISYTREYTRTRLLQIFLDICHGIAYAHTKGIVHRDLKPENILVGDYGEVLVLDWGLVKHLDHAKDKEDPDDEDKEYDLGIDTDESIQKVHTLEGTISGTPQFMAPEQARGNQNEIDTISDIYSLGVILYQILTYSFAFRGRTVNEILKSVTSGDFVPPRRKAPRRKIPRELEAICLKAMALEKKYRYESVELLIQDIRNYQENFPVSAYSDPPYIKLKKLCLRHRLLTTTFIGFIFALVLGYTAMNLVAYVRYNQIVEVADLNKEEGNNALLESMDAYRQLDKINTTKKTKEKNKFEQNLELKLSKAQILAKNKYDTALLLYSSVPEPYWSSDHINRAFINIMRNRIRFSLLTKNYGDTSKWLEMIRLWTYNHTENLTFEEKKELIAVEKLLRGDSIINIRTYPVEGTVNLFKQIPDREGIIRPVHHKELEKSPVLNQKIQPGDYLIEIKTEDHPTVLYPVRVKRGENLDANIYIPEKIPEGMVYVPGGKFYMGGEYSRHYRLFEEEISSFYIKKFEVTFREFLEYWKNIRYPARRIRFRSKIRLKQSDRHFIDAWDDNGKLIKQLKMDDPVVGITRKAAMGYCQWLSKETITEIRLPTAEEWEKAARGVDARNFVWGNEYNPDYAFIIENKEARKIHGFWATPGSFPIDKSIYGAFDMCGNVREWTSSKFPGDSPFYQIKGASSSTTKRYLYCAYSSDTPVIPSDVGFRYVMPIKTVPPSETKEVSGKITTTPIETENDASDDGTSKATENNLAPESN